MWVLGCVFVCINGGEKSGVIYTQDYEATHDLIQRYTVSFTEVIHILSTDLCG